jgi:transposase InsO family protein
MRIRDIAHQRPRFGYQRIHVMLRREGWLVNKKRVRRLYRLEGLQLRMRIRRRKHMCLHRGVVPQAQRTHERWSMDFVHDRVAPHVKAKYYAAILFQLVLDLLGLDGELAQAARRAGTRPCPNRPRNSVR